MAAESDHPEVRASQEATDWLILLQDDPDDLVLRRRFDAWIASDPLNAAAWAATRHTAGLLASMPPNHAGQWQSFAAAGRPSGMAGPAA